MDVCCFITTYMILLVLSFSVLFKDFVLANSNISSLHLQPKPVLCHSREKLALLGFKQNFLINCSVSTSSLAYPKLNSWENWRRQTDGKTKLQNNTIITFI